MASWDGATGKHYDFDDLPTQELVFSKDQSKALYWYESRNKSDLYDDDTLYKVTVWQVNTKSEITTFYRKHNYSLMTGVEAGGWVEQAYFSESADTVIIKTSDGKVTEEKLPNK
ncbi:MAG TPA: hypothetical protein DCS93_16525 [Microscillaceae bacterium]|nr:hypothetical protein [Microscillaceae bacterium]